VAAESFYTENPATGERIAEHQYLSSSEMEKVLEDSQKVASAARSVQSEERSRRLKALASELRKSSGELSRLISLEMGKPIKESRAEIEKSAKACEYFSDHLGEFLRPETVSSGYSEAKIVKDPIGPLFAIMPWNFPLWQTIRFAAPAIGIGNPILLKHSDLTAGTAAEIGRIFDRVARGLLYNLRINHDQAATVIADRRIAAVTLTGSERAGSQVAANAGKHLKKTVLELGGSDAYVVFADADVEKAARICAQSRMINNGQSCVAAKRFIVEKPVLRKFLEIFGETLRGMRLGDPMKDDTQVGSLAAKRFQTELLDRCGDLERDGAECLLDLAVEKGFDFSAKGAFFPARVYKVDRTNKVAVKEEFFGPVALVYEFGSTEEALDLSNRSVFGLGGAVFTADVGRAEMFAHMMEAGFVAINDQVRSDPALPFGGVKASGYGRELSRYGFDEFCNIKTIGFSRENPGKPGVE
jgi:succinate-semialdehyde dehydrogenase / glutarate-semialdehyde dehydrogenase